MQKAISKILLGSLVLSVLLSSCSSDKTNGENSTDLSDEMVAVIEKSSPVTPGNLITKTSTDKKGNVSVIYYDSNDNPVEEYVWNGDDKISHTVTTYTSTNKVSTKENISPDGDSNIMYSYQYNDNDELIQSTVSEFEDSLLKKSTTYDADENITGYSLNTYTDSGSISGIYIYDANDNLLEYFRYKYNSSGYQSGYSAYSADGSLQKYTTTEYDDNGNAILEKYFDADGNLLKYFKTDYYESGNIKSRTEYDSSGKIISSDTFDDNE